jgi:hypothetical protein
MAVEGKMLGDTEEKDLQMNYWPAEPANLAEYHIPFIDYADSIR